MLVKDDTGHDPSRSPRKSQSRQSRQSHHSRKSNHRVSQAPTQKKKHQRFSIVGPFRVAWATFVHYVKKAYTYSSGGGEPFVDALSKGFRVLCKMLIRLLRFLFYPVVLITRGVKYITKHIAKAFFTQWKRILAVLFIALALVVSIDEYKLAEWAGVQTVASNNAHTLALNKASLVKTLLGQQFLTPLIGFLTVGLPQLTYEMLRIWHFVLADGMTSLLDMMVAGLKLAKALLPSSAKALIAWDKLESATFSKRLHEARTADIHIGDPLLKSYLNAHQTLLDRQKQSKDAFRKAGWKKESRADLDKLWHSIKEDAKSGRSTSYNKYIKGEVNEVDSSNAKDLHRSNANDVRTLTLSQAFRQLKSTPTQLLYKKESTPKGMFSWVTNRTRRKKVGNLRGAKTRQSTSLSKATRTLHNIVNAVPQPVQQKVLDAYQTGARKLTMAIFHKNDPSEITVQNLSHLYFGLVAMGGASSGVVDGIRSAFFKHARTGAVVKLGAKMRAVEEVVPVCFYLDE